MKITAPSQDGTRELVARSILENGPSTASVLGERLGITPAGIRRHLDALLADGVVEAIEWKVKEGEPWLLAVQWHPERLWDKESNPLSKNIREKFLEAVRNNVD